MAVCKRVSPLNWLMKLLTIGLKAINAKGEELPGEDEV